MPRYTELVQVVLPEAPTQQESLTIDVSGSSANGLGTDQQIGQAVTLHDNNPNPQFFGKPMIGVITRAIMRTMRGGQGPDDVVLYSSGVELSTPDPNDPGYILPGQATAIYYHAADTITGTLRKAVRYLTKGVWISDGSAEVGVQLNGVYERGVDTSSGTFDRAQLQVQPGAVMTAIVGGAPSPVIGVDTDGGVALGAQATFHIHGDTSFTFGNYQQVRIGQDGFVRVYGSGGTLALIVGPDGTVVIGNAPHQLIAAPGQPITVNGHVV